VEVPSALTFWERPTHEELFRNVSERASFMRMLLQELGMQINQLKGVTTPEFGYRVQAGASETSTSSGPGARRHRGQPHAGRDQAVS
jgi:hypothetical protein